MELNPLDHGIHQPGAAGMIASLDPHQVGVPAGTEILTVDGALPVEFLSAGDRIISRDSGFVRVRKVRHDLCGGDWVVIRTGAFGPGKPAADLSLPAGQRVLLRGDLAMALFDQQQVLAPLSKLVGRPQFAICDGGPPQVFSIWCGQPQVIYAGGVELATAD